MEQHGVVSAADYLAPRRARAARHAHTHTLRRVLKSHLLPLAHGRRACLCRSSPRARRAARCARARPAAKAIVGCRSSGRARRAGRRARWCPAAQTSHGRHDRRSGHRRQPRRAARVGARPQQFCMSYPRRTGALMFGADSSVSARRRRRAAPAAPGAAQRARPTANCAPGDVGRRAPKTRRRARARSRPGACAARCRRPARELADVALAILGQRQPVRERARPHAQADDAAVRPEHRLRERFEASPAVDRTQFASPVLSVAPCDIPTHERRHRRRLVRAGRDPQNVAKERRVASRPVPDASSAKVAVPVVKSIGEPAPLPRAHADVLAVPRQDP